MFDVNSILTSAFLKAVDEATRPMEARIVALEATCRAYEILLQGMDERIAALEAKPSSDGLTRDEVREIASEAAAEAVGSHCSDYEHDDFIDDLSSIDLSDHIDLDRAVRDAVSNLSFEVSVS